MGELEAHCTFGIHLPDGWEDTTVHTFSGPDEDGIQHTLCLALERIVGNVVLDAFARERIDSVVASLPNLIILKEEHRSLPDDSEIYECVCKWIPADGNALLQKHVFAVKDGVGYTFTTTFSKKTIKTIGVVVDQIIESILSGENQFSNKDEAWS